MWIALVVEKWSSLGAELSLDAEVVLDAEAVPMSGHGPAGSTGFIAVFETKEGALEYAGAGGTVHELHPVSKDVRF